jgi:uncharacterized protein DUF397
MGSDVRFRWRKSSDSGENGERVELGAAWRKSSHSGENGACVELGNVGAVRDSKNPTGPRIGVDLDTFVRWVKTDR